MRQKSMSNAQKRGPKLYQPQICHSVPSWLDQNVWDRSLNKTLLTAERAVVPNRDHLLRWK